MSELIPYQYEDIQEDIKNRFINKGYTDINNEGSNANKLASILTGIASHLTLNLNSTLKESILTTAQNEDNIVRNALINGYSRLKPISYQYKVRVKAIKDNSLPDNDTSLRQYFIEKYTMFKSNGKTYYYFGDDLDRDISNNDITTDSPNSYFDVTIKEGVLMRYKDYPSLSHIVGTTLDNTGDSVPDSFFEIPYVNIEENGTELFVTYFDGTESYNLEKWVKSNSMLLEYTEEKKTFIVLENIQNSTHSIHWNYAGVGTFLEPGSQLNANILISSGINGESSNLEFTIEDTDRFEISGLAILEIQGSNQESKEQIAINAPRFNNTANRAITRLDYQALCDRRPEVQSSVVWGSEDELPQYRKSSWFSFLPFYKNNDFIFNNIDTYTRLFSNFFLDNSEIQEIFKYLDEYKIPTLKLEYRHPTYINFDYNIQIAKYNINKSISEVNESIYVAIKNYFYSVLEYFGTEYFQSNVIKRINEVVTDSSGITISTDVYFNLQDIMFNSNSEELATCSDTGVDYLLPNNDSEKKYILQIGYPFDDIFEANGDVITDNLPSINTLNWLGLGPNLELDLTSEHLYYEYPSFDIKYNNIVCGKYIILNGVEEYIRIELYAVDTSSSDSPNRPEYINTPLTLDMFTGNGIKTNLIYTNNNISLYRNSIPRLNEIKFDI